MSSPSDAPLTFEKADFGDGHAAEVMTCAICGRNVEVAYYEINGVNVCEDCKGQVADTQKAEGGARRFVGAALLGVGGGFLGAVIWYAVAELFDLQIGLIAILVGWLVGSGVHRGSQGRGGLKYQLLAAVVTYVSICSTYIPYLLPSSTDNSATVYAAFVIVFALIAPFWLGTSNIIGILIIGFALYQAWKMNAARAFDVKGPFRLARGSVSGGASDVIDLAATTVQHPNEPSST